MNWRKRYENKLKGQSADFVYLDENVDFHIDLDLLEKIQIGIRQIVNDRLTPSEIVLCEDSFDKVMGEIRVVNGIGELSLFGIRLKCNNEPEQFTDCITSKDSDGNQVVFLI